MHIEYSEFIYFLDLRGPGGWARAIAVVALMALVAGCAGSRSQRQETAIPVSVRAEPSDVDRRPADPGPDPAEERGIRHVVQPGQTLWRIAVAYGLTPQELARVNQIEDPTDLPVGIALLVPGAREVLEVSAFPAPLKGGKAVRPDYPAGSSPTWYWPVPDGDVLSYFGASRGSRRHAGVDIRGPHGAKVVASREGKVVYSGSGMRGYGKTVIVDHGDRFTTLYAHNSKLLVRVGERVRRGQTIALVGRSGNASGDHCHFEIRRDDRPIDPLPYLIPPLEARR